MVDGLGKLIVARRKVLGYSQQELACMIGVPAANLSQLEHSPSRWRSRLIPALGISQLESVVAARVISDLPPFPSPGAAQELNDSLLPSLEINGHVGPERSKERLRTLPDDLAPSEAEFLLAVAESIYIGQPRRLVDADDLSPAIDSETVGARLDEDASLSAAPTTDDLPNLRRDRADRLKICENPFSAREPAPYPSSPGARIGHSLTR